MPTWRDLIRGDSFAWLLQADEGNPAVRYLALRDLVGLPEDYPELIAAKSAAYSTGTIPKILAAQNPKGYWVKPGGGYNPKYTGTVWSLTALAQMGADKSEARLGTAVEYLLNNALSPLGWLSYNGTPSGFIHCHSGYLGEAMVNLGYFENLKVRAAIEWQAKFITGEGVASNGSADPVRYFAYTSGPDFACGPNGGKPCAWGVVKAMKALASVPASFRTPIMHDAIDRGRSFLLGVDLTRCNFPNRTNSKPSTNWFKFGFPNFYIGDMLEILEVMARLGEGNNSKLESAWKLVFDKQDGLGRWPMEYSYNGKIWSDIEVKGEPSKWVTLRVLRTLKTAFPD